MEKTIRVFCDGSGQGPNGRASGFAWLRLDTRERCVERIAGMTNNEAEYRAVIAVLKPMPVGAHIEVVTDSALVVGQLRGEFRILEPKLVELASEVKTIAEEKQLELTLTWVPRSQNLAGKLL